MTSKVILQLEWQQHYACIVYCFLLFQNSFDGSSLLVVDIDILQFSVCIWLLSHFPVWFITHLGIFPVGTEFTSLSTEALGNNAGPSTSPPAGERKLFSDVTRLGFASAQDSPPLRIETGDASGKNDSARDQGRYHACLELEYCSGYQNLISN